MTAFISRQLTEKLHEVTALQSVPTFVTINEGLRHKVGQNPGQYREYCGIKTLLNKKTIRPHHHTRSRWSSVSSLTIQRVYLLDRETPTRLRHKTQKINGPLNYNASLTKAWNQVCKWGNFGDISLREPRQKLNWICL